MKRIYAYGTVRDGQRTIRNQKSFEEDWSSVDGDFMVTVEWGKRRSHRFNAYYHGLCGYLAKETGTTSEYVHNLNKLECNAIIFTIENQVTGELEEARVGVSTAKLSTEEFMGFLERVRQFWAERGYYVPDNYWEEE